MAQPQFSQIVASASRESMVITNINPAASIGTGAGETIDFYAPAGTICKVSMVSLLVNAPAGAANGTHLFALDSTDSNINYIQGTSVFGSSVWFRFGEWFTSDSSKFPAVSPPINVIQSITFDSLVGVRFRYVNGTNVIQNNARSYTILYNKRLVG